MVFDPLHHDHDDEEEVRGGEATTRDEDFTNEGGNPLENLGENIRHGFEETKEDARHEIEEVKNKID